MPMTSTLSVVLVHRNDLERGQLRSAFEALPGVQIAGERPDVRSALALANSVQPDILVLELSSPVDDILKVASQYRLEHPDCAIFFATEVFDSDTLLRAMRSGAQEILRRPLDRGALTSAVERVGALRARKHGGASTRSVIAVFSNKGGSGVSTIATNLAVCMRHETGRDVALADFDHQSGDVAFMLGLAPLRSVSDVLAAPRIESAVIQDALTKHSTGVYVLSQPEQLDRVDGATGHQIGSVLDVLSHTFDTVVVDCPHVFTEIVLEIFDRASAILLVVEPSVSSVRAGRRSLEIFHKLNYMVASDRVRLVVNRANEKSEVGTQQIAETLGLPLFATIANDYTSVIRAINAGKPVCEQLPDSRVSIDLVGLARKLVPGAAMAEPAELEPVARQRPGRFRLFGKGKAS
jgi:pilus assembly protein CpaE